MKRVARSESSIAKAVVTAAKKRWGVESIKLSTSGHYGTGGWPDRLFLIPGGRPLFIEFKSASGWTLTELQAHRIHLLRTAGYDAEVHYSVADAIYAIKCKIRDPEDDEEKTVESHVESAERMAPAQLPEAGGEVARGQRSRKKAPRTR